MSATDFSSLPDAEAEALWEQEWRRVFGRLGTNPTSAQVAAAQREVNETAISQEIRRRREGEFLRFLRNARKAEAQARAQFLAERISFLPKAKRPDEKGLKDLDRRLLAADPMVGFNGLHAVVSLLEDGHAKGRLFRKELEALEQAEGGATSSRWVDLVRVALQGEVVHETPPMESPDDLKKAHRLFLSLIWPKVWKQYQADQIAHWGFRVPMEMVELNQAIGARGARFGMAEGLPVTPTLAGQKITKIVVELPKGGQLTLGSPGRYVPAPDDFDETGTIRPEAIWRAIDQVAGPEVAMMGYVALAMAEQDGRSEGRKPDGRFWWWPTRAAELLGYPKESRGRDRPAQISPKVVKEMQKRFELYADIVLNLEIRRRGSRERTLEGHPLIPYWKEREGNAEQRGRRKREDWGVHPDIWDLIRSYSVELPTEALHAGGMRPAHWALCFHVYVALVTHARHNAADVKAGERLTLGLKTLHSKAKVLTGVRADHRDRRMWGLLERLNERKLVDARPCTLKSGEPGVSYLLLERPAASISRVATQAEKKALPAPKKGRKL